MNQLLREVIADELERIGDERLEQVAVTQVEVDRELQRAVVYVDSLGGEAADAIVLEALGQHRVRLQAAIGRQVRARRTPLLVFRPDEVIRSADRIEGILRSLPPVTTSDDDAGAKAHAEVPEVVDDQAERGDEGDDDR